MFYMWHHINMFNQKKYLKEYREKNKDLLNKKVREKHKKRYGISCARCNSKLDGKSKRLCLKCLKFQSEASLRLREKTKKKNCCVRCRSSDYIKNRIDMHRFKPAKVKLCIACYLKRMSYSVCGSQKLWEKLLKLFNEQNQLCVYTGEKLIIGVNASIDHINPRVKGGSNKIENLQWVDFRINLMKRDLVEPEFLKLIKKIHGYSG